MSALVQEDCTRCKISARIRTDLVQAACTKAVSQIQVSGCKKHVCGRHRCTKRRTGLVFYRLTCTSSAVRTVQKWALGTVLRAQEPPFVRHLYEKTTLRGSESTPCTNRYKPDTSKFQVFQVPGLISTVRWSLPGRQPPRAPPAQWGLDHVPGRSCICLNTVGYKLIQASISCTDWVLFVQSFCMALARRLLGVHRIVA